MLPPPALRTVGGTGGSGSTYTSTVPSRAPCQIEPIFGLSLFFLYLCLSLRKSNSKMDPKWSAHSEFNVMCPSRLCQSKTETVKLLLSQAGSRALRSALDMEAGKIGQPNCFAGF